MAIAEQTISTAYNKDDLIFRDAGIGDLPLIVDIYNSTVAGRMVTADTEVVSVDSKEDWFYAHESSSRPLWIIETKAAESVGWASFQSFYGRPAYSGTSEISIYLTGNMRGKGYGKAVLQYCIEKAPSLELHTLLGFIFAHNLPSIKLFQNAGFEEWAHLKDVALIDERFLSLKIFGRKV